MLGNVKIKITDEMSAILREKDAQSQPVLLGIRPEHMSIARHDEEGAVHAKVDVTEMMGSEMHMHLNVDGQDVVVRVPTIDLDERFRGGVGSISEIDFKFSAALIHLFSEENGNNLLV